MGNKQLVHEAAVAYGRKGGKASARSLNASQRHERALKGGNAIASKFNTPEERSAYYRDLQKKGTEAKRKNNS